MKASRVKEVIRIAYEAKKPVFLSGPPGVGKSDVVSQAAKEMGIDLIDERMLQRDVVDVRGFPHIVDGVARFTRPDYMPTKGKGILFLDELNAAPPLVQAACYQLILDRRIGDHKLPKGWLPIAAGNRETDMAVVSRMPSPLANRFVHIDFDVDMDEWVAWALKNTIRTELIAFLRFRPALLMDFNVQVDTGDNRRPERDTRKAFATPRSNETLSRLMDACGGDIDYELVAGTTGEAHATEFMAFLEVYKTLPDPDVVLMAPKKAPVPDEPSVCWALCGALAEKASEQNFGALVEYSYRLQSEFSVLLVNDAVSRKPELIKTRTFIEWASKQSGVLV